MKLRIFILFVLLLWPWTMLSAEAAAGRILVLNSDATVVKYRTVEREFLANLSVDHRSLNMGGNKHPLDPTQIKHAIHDYDPKVIYCIGTKALTVAQKLASQRKLIFSSIMNWRRLPMNENTFGVSNDLHVGMQVTLFRYLFPDLKQVGIIYNKRFNREWVEIATQEAGNAGIKIIGYPIEHKSELQQILTASLPNLDAIWLIADPVVLSDKTGIKRLFQAAETQKKPVFAYIDVFAHFGAALILSVDLPTIARQAAMLAEKLAKGQPTPKERVLDPAGSRIALNKHKIARYGLPLNKSALGAVNTFIE